MTSLKSFSIGLLVLFFSLSAHADVAPPAGTHNLQLGVSIVNLDEYPGYSFSWSSRELNDTSRIDWGDNPGDTEILNSEPGYPRRDWLVARKTDDTTLTWTYWAGPYGERLFGISESIAEVKESYRIDSLSGDKIHLTLVETQYLDEDGKPTGYAGADEVQAQRRLRIGIGVVAGLVFVVLVFLVRRKRIRRRHA